MSREFGKVKFFLREKGYGFITSDAGKDVFVHRSDFAAGLELLVADQRVSFVIGKNKHKNGNGEKAIAVTVER